MKFLKSIFFILFSVQTMFIVGCGGGGGGGNSSGGSTTKTATLVFSSYSASAQIAGFDLTVTLPKNVTITTDSSGAPLSSVVYLSGRFSVYGATLYPAGVTYDATSSTSNKLIVSYGGTDSYPVGEFLTVVCNVPVSYTPDINNVSLTASFKSSSGTEIPGAYAKATFTSN